jgi:hypothetical protein
MQTGTIVTLVSPLGDRNERNRPVSGRYMAVRGTYAGRNERGERIVALVSGGRIHVPIGQGHRITTKPCDISPCGLLE